MDIVDPGLPAINLADFRKASLDAQNRRTRNNVIASAAFGLAGLAALATALVVLNSNEPKMASAVHASQRPGSAALN